MKLDRLETHDRLLVFKKQSEDISQGVQECLRNVPEAITCPFYIYGHARAVDDDEKTSLIIQGHTKAPDQRLIWGPRITKPKASSNSYLFLCHKNSDIIETIWMIPKKELWDQYKPGQLCHNPGIWTSILNYTRSRELLNSPDKNGPTPRDEELFRRVYGEEAYRRKAEKSNVKLMDKLYMKEKP